MLQSDSGPTRHTTSSATSTMASATGAGITGTASTTRAGARLRSDSIAARQVRPVDAPSSTKMTVRPLTSSGLRPARKCRTRRSSSSALACASSGAAAGVSSLETFASSATTTTPCSARRVWPAFCTTATSSGARKALATSAPTGTPPQGTAMITGRCSL